MFNISPRIGMANFKNVLKFGPFKKKKKMTMVILSIRLSFILNCFEWNSFRCCTLLTTILIHRQKH